MRGAALALILSAWPLSSGAEMAPQLGAASNFGQGWQPRMLHAAGQLPVTDFRDAVYWNRIETPRGRYTYADPRDTFPDLLADRGYGMSLTVNNGHPAYDAGHTPFSPEAVAGFARFAAEAVRRFPAIHSVEVGNEMNSAGFVSGPGWEAPLTARAVAYTALLKATAEAVRAERPGTRILGAAAHSIPLHWFDALGAAGAAPYMDALVIHPYGEEPEQVRRQIALLRTRPDWAEMPIEVTEIGHTDPAKAPALLMKTYCQMALAGGSRVIWYPLNPRGDGLVPLLRRSGALTGVGEAYRFISAHLSGQPVVEAAPDPFTYGCRFGAHHLMLWGAARDLTVAPGTQVYDTQGRPLEGTIFRLSRAAPLIVIAPDQPVAEAIELAPQQVIADSVDQFTYPGQPGFDPFQRYVDHQGQLSPLDLRPGQQKSGVPWVPYLGSSLDSILRAGANWVLPSRPASGPLPVVYQYTASEAGRVDITVDIAPAARSEDGVRLRVLLNGTTLTDLAVTEPEYLRLEGVALQPEDALLFQVGPRATARGDITGLRVTLSRAAP